MTQVFNEQNFLENSPAITNDMTSLGLTTTVEQARAIQEVQASLIIAKRFPRDETAAYNSIMKSCERFSLAEQSMYSFPRGRETVSGPSIRLAEVLAMNWENLDYGWEEQERITGKSKCMAYCWDKQRNNKKVIKFEVEHFVEVGQKGAKTKKRLTDPRDIYELCANHAARRMRACILANIPGDITEAAVKACKVTLSKGNGATLEDRIRDVVNRFSKIGVNQEMLEERLGHKVSLMTGDEISELVPIYKSIIDKQAKRSDFFKTKESDKPQSTLNEKLIKDQEQEQGNEKI